MTPAASHAGSGDAGGGDGSGRLVAVTAAGARAGAVTAAGAGAAEPAPVHPASVELVIFDFDGTLADLPLDWVQVRERVGLTAGEPLGPAVERFIANGDLGALRALTELELAAVGRCRLHEDVASTLALLCACFSVAIWTRNSRHLPERVLAAAGVEPLFTVGREDVARLKPDPEGARAILGYFGCRPAQAVMVGDTWHDVQAAQRAGLRSVLLDRDGDAAARHGAGDCRLIASIGDLAGLLLPSGD